MCIGSMYVVLAQGTVEMIGKKDRFYMIKERRQVEKVEGEAPLRMVQIFQQELPSENGLLKLATDAVLGIGISISISIRRFELLLLVYQYQYQYQYQYLAKHEV